MGSMAENLKMIIYNIQITLQENISEDFMIFFFVKSKTSQLNLYAYLFHAMDKSV